MIRALEIQRRLKNVPQLNVPVILNIYNNSRNEKVCYFKTQLIHSQLIILQPFLLSGNHGANGLVVRQRVATDPEFGDVVAVNQPLGAMISVPGIQRRLRTVCQLSVQVFHWVP